jgi:hypothetical protein
MKERARTAFEHQGSCAQAETDIELFGKPLIHTKRNTIQTGRGDNLDNRPKTGLENGMITENTFGLFRRTLEREAQEA